MIKYIYLIIGLLPSLAFGYSGNLTPPDTVIVTNGMLPYTMSASNTAYIITGNTLNSTTNGLYADAIHDVTITGDWTGSPNHNVIVNIASGGGDSYYGIRLERCYDVYIRGLALQINNNSNLEADSSNRLIILDRCDSIWIDQCNIVPSGLDSKGIWLTNSSRLKKIDITYCLPRPFFSENNGTLSDWFTSRTAYGAAWLLVNHQSQTPLDTAIGEYHLYVAHNEIDRSIHTAFAFIGRDVEFGSGNYGGLLVYCDSNTITMAKRNDKYLAQEGETNSSHSAGDAFAITLDGVRGGSHFIGNTFQVSNEDSTYGGSGFLVQGAHGTADYPVVFQGNQFFLSEGETPAFISEIRASAMFFYPRRFLQTGSASADSSYNKYCIFKENYGINYVDTSEATTHIGRVYEGVRFGANSIYSETMVFQNNHFECGVRTDVAPTSPNGGATQIIGAALTYHQLDEVTSTRMIGNYWGGYDMVWWLFGTRIEAPANNLLSYRDTLYQRADSDTTIYFYPWSQSTADHHINNQVWDATFLGYADPTKVVFSNCFSIDSLGKSIEFWQTLELLVLGSDGNPALLSGVRLTNSYEDRFLGHTDYQGWLRKPLKTRYEHFDCVSDGYNPGDSLAFEPFTLTAYSFDGTDTAQIVMSLMEQRIDTVQFTTVIGSQPPPRTYLMLRKKINPADDAEWLGPPDQ